MNRSAALGILALLTLSCAVSADASWPEAKSPAIPSASGLVVIPGATHASGRKRVYHAVFDATRGADQPDHLLPALDNAGSELNAIAASGFSLSNHSSPSCSTGMPSPESWALCSEDCGWIGDRQLDGG